MEDGSGGIILQVAADLYGKKENVYVELRDGVPGLETVVDIVERVYDAEAKACCPPNAPTYVPFKIQYMQYFDPTKGWVDIVNSSQLRHMMQIFVFQPTNSSHSDSQDLIPVAKHPVLTDYWKVNEREFGRVTKDASRSPTRSPVRKPENVDVKGRQEFAQRLLTFEGEDELKAAFDRFDTEMTGFVPLEAIRRAFVIMNVDLSPSTIASLLGRPPCSDDDAHVDTRCIAFDDWCMFAENHPNIAHALCQHQVDGSLPSPPQVMKDVVDGQRRRLEVLQKSHKDAVARAQMQAAVRLTKGKSCKVTERERNVKSTPRANSTGSARQSRSAGRTNSWKPAGVNRATSPANTARRPTSPKTIRTASNGTSSRGKQSSSARKGGYSAVPATQLKTPGPGTAASPTEKAARASSRFQTFGSSLSPTNARTASPLKCLPSTASYAVLEEEMNRMQSKAYGQPETGYHIGPRTVSPFEGRDDGYYHLNTHHQHLSYEPHQDQYLDFRAYPPIRSPGGSCIPQPVPPRSALAPSQDGPRWGNWVSPPAPSLTDESSRRFPPLPAAPPASHGPSTERSPFDQRTINSDYAGCSTSRSSFPTPAESTDAATLASLPEKKHVLTSLPAGAQSGRRWYPNLVSPAL